jgi:hypothetical protein
MHDPHSVVGSLRWPLGRKSEILTIWHKDPKTNGSDDSCGIFMRSRHGDPVVLDRIRKDFEFEWSNSWGGWFDSDGNPSLSVQAIALGMVRIAAIEHLGYRKARHFLRDNLHEIMYLAENTVDSLHDSITNRYGRQERGDRIDFLSSVVYGWVLRMTRPWWKHPRFHLHHLSVQWHWGQAVRRWLFDRCSKCGRRFAWREPPYGTRGSKERWHDSCQRISASSSNTMETK